MSTAAWLSLSGVFCIALPFIIMGALGVVDALTGVFPRHEKAIAGIARIIVGPCLLTGSVLVLAALASVVGELLLL